MDLKTYILIYQSTLRGKTKKNTDEVLVFSNYSLSLPSNKNNTSTKFHIKSTPTSPRFLDTDLSIIVAIYHSRRTRQNISTFVAQPCYDWAIHIISCLCHFHAGPSSPGALCMRCHYLLRLTCDMLYVVEMRMFTSIYGGYLLWNVCCWMGVNIGDCEYC